MDNNTNLTKKCSKCGIEKELGEFYNNKTKIVYNCKICSRKLHKEYRIAHIEQFKRYSEKSRAKHKDKINQRIREWRIKNKEILKLRNNKLKYCNQTPEYKKHICDRLKLRYNTDLNFKLRKILSKRVYRALKLKAYSKVCNTMALVGCSIKELKKYLEDKFEQMFGFKFDWSWHNQKQYHIDHIIPCASFSLIDVAEQRKCFHYTNLQLLPAEINLSKGDKLDYQIHI